jgi:hypothetical protein
MNSPVNLAAQIAEKPNEQLVEMIRHPHDWLAEALDLAGAELQRRGISHLDVATPVQADPANSKDYPHANFKIQRYHIMVVGCLAHAICLQVLGHQIQMADSDHRQPHWNPPVWLWLGLLLIWPRWGIALWHCGHKKKLAVVIPMIVGIVIMWPILETAVYLIFILLCLMG